MSSSVATRVIIFDFDGVLVDSFECAFLANQKAAAHIGKRLIKSEYRSWFADNFHTGKEHFVGNRRDLAVYNTRRLQELRKYYNPPLFPFAKKLVVAARGKGSVAVISSLDPVVLRRYASPFRFAYVVGGSKEKTRDIKKLLRETKAVSSCSIFITDTSGDVRAGKRAGVLTVGVGWGFEGAAIRDSQPDYFFKSSAPLLRWFTQKSFV